MINIKFPHLSNKDGFTLIELVVAFSIMAVLSTIGIASFVGYSQAQTLQQATNDVTTVLNTAKSNAISQVKPIISNSTCLQGVLNGYQVVLGNQIVSGKSTASYTLYAVCNGAPDQLSKITKQLNGVSFDSTTFVSPATTATITFLVLTGGVTSTGVVGANGTSIILDGVNNTQKTITVTQGGLIQ